MHGWVGTRVATGLCLVLALSPGAAHAESAGDAPQLAAGSPEAAAAARTHFAHAKQLYGAGSYREAIGELDAARALDPKAKDLVYNLAIVHEKLGELDDALRYARLYLDMDLDPQERTRGEGYVKRLEGAKAEVVVVPKPPAPSTTPLESKPAASDSPARGRLDALTLGAAGVSAAALIAGTVMGVKALADKPSSSFVTGQDGTLATLQSETNSAHTEAIVADVCFGVGIAAAVAAAGLYFGRTKDPAATSGTRSRSWQLVPVALRSGGGLLLGGAF